MSYIRAKEIPPRSGNWYDYEVRSVRRGNKVIQEHIRYIGKSGKTTGRINVLPVRDRIIDSKPSEPKVTCKYCGSDHTRKYGTYLDVNYGKDAEHRQGSPFSVKDSGESTSQIERFHGTLKSRTKVMRGLKNLESAVEFTQGWLVHYNYLRPHESLNDKTPAEVAGITYPYQNWADIIRKHTPSVKVTIEHQPRDRVKLPRIQVGRPRKVRISPRTPRITPKTPRLRDVPGMPGVVESGRGKSRRRHLRLY